MRRKIYVVLVAAIMLFASGCNLFSMTREIIGDEVADEITQAFKETLQAQYDEVEDQLIDTLDEAKEETIGEAKEKVQDFVGIFDQELWGVDSFRELVASDYKGINLEPEEDVLFISEGTQFESMDIKLPFIFLNEDLRNRLLPLLEEDYYAELERDYAEQCTPYIQSQYQSYVLKAIEKHIQSGKGKYRVCRNLLKIDKQGKTSTGGNIIFFFDGVSTQLEDAAVVASGFEKPDGKRYNISAVCLVVQVNEDDRPVLAYIGFASTMADNVRDETLNTGKAVPVVLDGIYDVGTTNHVGEYAALKNGNGAAVTALRCSRKGASFLDSTGASNIHARSAFNGTVGNEITDKTYNSTGCFNVGLFPENEGAYNRNDYSQYNDLIEAVTGKSNARNGAFSTAGQDVGLVVVDRSCYYEQLKTIFGDDQAKDGMTANMIADIITETSRKWHAEIEN